MTVDSETRFGPEEFQAETNVSRETIERLEKYFEILNTWSTRINLIGPGTMGQIWHRQFFDSAQFLSHASPHGADTQQIWADIGSGAGFPGMVLAILGVGPMHLVEANSNKCDFLAEVARATGTQVTLHDKRVETMGPEDFSGSSPGVIAVRAVAPLPKILKSISKIVTPATVLLFAAGQDVGEALTNAAKPWKMTVERLPSVTHPASNILRIQGLRSNGAKAEIE